MTKRNKRNLTIGVLILAALFFSRKSMPAIPPGSTGPLPTGDPEGPTKPTDPGSVDMGK